MGGSKKGFDWRLGAIDNKVEIINPKNSLLDYIKTRPNPSSTNMLNIADSGVNIHITKQTTHTMTPVMM